MRIRTLIFTGLLLMTTAFTAFAESKSTGGTATDSAGRTLLTRLPNGLTVLVKKDDRFPLVSLRLYVHAGSAYERPGEEGISHMLEHMVFKGTDKRPKGMVAADVEKTGGYLNAATSFDYTVYLTDMTKDYWKTGLDVLKDMAFNPSLDPQELESEKDVVVAELKRGEDTPGQRLFRMTQQAALQGTPYYHPIIGYEKTVRDLSSEVIRDYISRLYQPQSMLLLACGNVDPEEFLAEASRLFGDLGNKHIIRPPMSETDIFTPKGFTATVEEGPWNKVHLSMAIPVPGMQDMRSSQLDVLAQILGGDATSRFYRTYKYEKRLVDSISASNYSFERLGLFYISATLDADKLAPFWETFSKDLAGLEKSAFTAEELNRAKLNLEDDMFRSKETLSGYASKLGYFAFFSDGEQSEANYLNTIRDTDQKVLHGLLRDFFKPDAVSLIALLPKDAAQPKEVAAAGKEDTRNWEAWFAKSLQTKWKAPAEDAAKKENEAAKGETETIDLGQGRTLVLIPDPTLPYAAVNMLFSGGDSLMSEKDQGLAAFTASLLTKGTKKLSATALEDFLSDRAAAFAASTGKQSFSVGMNAPSRFMKDMFDLLQATLVTPAMKEEEEAVRVRENQIAAITVREDRPTALAFRRMFHFFFGNHPYGYLTLGEKERVARFTAKDARDFWKEQTLQPWVLTVCGTYDKEAILAAVKKLPVPAKKEKEIPEPHWGDSKELDLKLPERNQAHLMLVFPTVGYGTEDEPGLDLLQNILAGQSGLLFRDLRDKQGLGYTVTAFPWKTQKTGALIFYIGTEPDKMEQAEKGFRDVIAMLQTQVLPEEELERGKNQMQGDYYRDHQSLSSRSAEAAILTILGQPLDASRKLVEKAKKVDAQALQKLAQTYLQPEKAYIVKVLP